MKPRYIGSEEASLFFVIRTAFVGIGHAGFGPLIGMRFALGPAWERAAATLPNLRKPCQS
jgi:hypothetical protein